LQSWYQCLDCFNCTQESCKNLQSTPFRPITPFEVTEVTPRARHVHLLVQTYRKYPYLNGSVSHSNSFILKNCAGPKIAKKRAKNSTARRRLLRQGPPCAATHASHVRSSLSLLLTLWGVRIGKFWSAWATLVTCVELLLGRSYTGMCVWQRESFARIFKAIAVQLDVVFVDNGYVSGVDRVGRITRRL
jgi:hypothetical protein